MTEVNDWIFPRTIPDVVAVQLPKEKKPKPRKPNRNDELEQAELALLEHIDGVPDTVLKFRYQDGYQRKFGQQYKVQEFTERMAVNKKNEQFIYEGPTEPKQTRSGKRKRDDTRSLYDDPKMQQIRQSNLTRKMIKSIQSIEKGEDAQWFPLLSTTQIPESFYMKKQFDSPYGPVNMDSDSIETEYDAFKLYYNDDIYDMIMKNTTQRNNEKFMESIYAYCHGYIKRKPYFVDWELQPKELDGYFSIQLFFGIVRLSNQGDYWFRKKTQTPKNAYMSNLDSKARMQFHVNRKCDIYGKYVQQKMATIMPYERFKEIKRSLNISSGRPTPEQKQDPIWKVRPFLEKMNELFAYYYKPEEYLTVDEGMIPFNGKVHFKVFNPDKPTKWGIKEYLLCDAQKCYTFQVRLYHGQTMWDNEFKCTDLLRDEDTTSKTMELVLQMLKPYEGKQHKVIMDNYYTSCQLFKELRNREIGALGTIRHNRTGLTKYDIMSEHFQQIYKENYTAHASYINRNRDTILLYFQGTSDKEVALLSNYLDNSLNDQHKFNIAKNHVWNPHPRQPYQIYIYNKYRGGVDRRNAFVMSYRSRFPVRKWWQSVFERMFETSLLNAFLVFKSINPANLIGRKGLIRDFRINLMYYLAERFKDYERDVELGKEACKRIVRRLEEHTFMNGAVWTKCIECGRKTKYFCQECTVLKQEVVGLCSETRNVRCQRFHEYDQFDLSRDRIVVDRRFRFDSYEIKNEIKDLCIQQNELKKIRTNLLAKQFQKKEKMDTLARIANLISSDDHQGRKEELFAKLQEQIQMHPISEESDNASERSSVKIIKHDRGDCTSESRFKYSTDLECEVNSEFVSEDDLDDEGMHYSDIQINLTDSETESDTSSSSSSSSTSKNSNESNSIDQYSDTEDYIERQYKKFQTNFYRQRSLMKKSAPMKREKKFVKKNIKKNYDADLLNQQENLVSGGVPDEFSLRAIAGMYNLTRTAVN